MFYLCDLFFIFIFTVSMINRMNTGRLVLLLIFQNLDYCLCLITWMKNVNNFLALLIKVLLIKKRVVQFISADCTELLWWIIPCRRTTSYQRWNNFVYVNVVICNVQQRWNNVVYLNVELNNVRQRRNNVVIFNIDFHNVGQRRNNVANMTIWKKIKPRFKSKIIFLSFKVYAGLKIFFNFSPF